MPPGTAPSGPIQPSAPLSVCAMRGPGMPVGERDLLDALELVREREVQLEIAGHLVLAHGRGDRCLRSSTVFSAAIFASPPIALRTSASTSRDFASLGAGAEAGAGAAGAGAAAGAAASRPGARAPGRSQARCEERHRDSSIGGEEA